MTSIPSFRNASTQRTAFFNKLKPCCLAIAKAVHNSKASGSNNDSHNASALLEQTGKLYELLVEQIGYDASVLDPSMADYVLFPLIPIFQHTERYPTRLVENATKCLRVLIQDGWKTAITKENAQNFLILLTSVVTGGGSSRSSGETKAKRELPEETTVEGYRALAALMRTAGAVGPNSPLIASNVIPALAHTVTVLLEGVTDSVIPAVQLEALTGVEALYTTTKDLEALSSFLPGAVSALVRLFSQPGSGKIPKKVVVRTLEVLYAILVHTLGDLPTRKVVATSCTSASTEKEDANVSTDNASETTLVNKPKLDGAWLKATASQVKLALSSVLKLRSHASEDVRSAVHRFCLGLLDECHASLAECAPLLVESAIVTSSDDEPSAETQIAASSLATPKFGFGPQTTLQDLSIIYPELADVVKATAYSWATSLPRAMQSSEDESKQRALRNVQKAIAVLEAFQTDSSTFESSLASSLRDSVVTLVLSSASTPSTSAAVHDADAEDDLLRGGGGQLALLRSDAKAIQLQRPYHAVLLDHRSQRGTREALLRLIEHVGTASQKARLSAYMLDEVRDSNGLDQVATFWLSFELIKASYATSAEADQLFDFSSLGDGGGGGGATDQDAVFEDLFSFSVSTLAAHSDAAIYDQDWRLGAVALEVTAFAASRLGEAFRPELIDVLYPIATYLGSADGRLQQHAVTTLNSLAASTGYASVSELIVDNVDYMLNSVSLRLNTFDISPASTKVLTMMIRLAGPRLVPYLDDVVASIFAALDNYHGYPLFVESLFAVLGEVVQQSVQSDMLLLEDASATDKNREDHKRKDGPASSTEDLVDILDRRAKRRKLLAEEEEKERETQKADNIHHHPNRPFSSEADELLRKHENPDDGDSDEDEGEDAEINDRQTAPKPKKRREEDKKPEDPKTPTYALLARITTLTQHYLTSPTPTLRKALLDLLVIVAPALAGDENAFLPLVNAVWPVAVARLYDGEPYVVVAACHALGALCSSAGGFVASRVKAEWNSGLRSWCTRRKQEAANKMAGGGGSKTRKATAKVPSIIRLGRAQPVLPEPKQELVLPLRRGTGNIDGDDVSLASLTPSAASTDSTASGIGLGRFAQAMQVWEAVAGFLTDVVAHVRLEDKLYDDILELLLSSPKTLVSTSTSQHRHVQLLSPTAEQRAREALAEVNADAVWLADYEAGHIVEGWEVRIRGMPELESVSFVPIIRKMQ